jgi:hypothetical protein
VSTYTLAWGWNDADPSGQNTIQVTTIEELDAALDSLTTGGPYLITVYEGTWATGEPARPDGFQLVWGHPQRAALTWLGDDAAIAVDPSLPQWPEPIGHDQDAASPRRTRLTPAQARRALREYLRTGRRPTSVVWLE